jgi:RNA polymerase sigma-70 factor (ECF subfamily)
MSRVPPTPGEAPGFDGLYRALSGPVGKLCLHVCGNRAVAEDAFQETFLAVHRALPAFRGESKASTWVYRIALRAALRARARRPEVELGAGLEPHQVPEPALEARDEARRVLAAMARLSAEQRAVLSLFAIDGLGHQEIAEVLGVPVGTVWSRLHLARKKQALTLDAPTP